MAHKNIVEKFKEMKKGQKKLVFALGVSALILGSVTYVAAHKRAATLVEHAEPEAAHGAEHATDHAVEHNSNHEPNHAQMSGFAKVWSHYGQLWISIQDKVDHLRQVDEDNERLRLENAHLRVVLEAQRYENYQERAQSTTKALEWKLSKDTGDKAGRTPVSIGYRVPNDLLPYQLYTLGTSYFKNGENEKAAVILHFLNNLDGDDTYKSPQNFLLEAIAWYRVQNYELAEIQLQQVDHYTHGNNSGVARTIKRQALLWSGLVAEKTGKHLKSQNLLREVLDHAPRSLEASWINRKSADPSTNRLNALVEAGAAKTTTTVENEEGDREPAAEHSSKKAE